MITGDWAVMAQAAPTGNQLVDTITTIGLSGIFLWLYLRAEGERKNSQSTAVDLIERVIPVLQEVTKTLPDVIKTIGQVAQQQTPKSDLETTLKEVQQFLKEKRS